MRLTLTRHRCERRGFTLVEMLVVVALVVLMMTILVQIFAAATGAMSVSRSIQQLDQRLRMLDGVLRSDLRGVTARMTPPNDPKDNLGYFEYAENAFADLQGEDTDDYLAFTAQAPDGQPFSGRIWVNAGAAGIQPVTVTSEFAEIIYFLRGGNLYRRVLLVAPERAGSLTPPLFPLPPGNPTGLLFNGVLVSWQGMNDISARPAPPTSTTRTPIPNTLGDLTNRQWRFGRPRFVDDYANNISGAVGADGVPDDANNDQVPDYYPTLYPNVYNTGLVTEPRPANVSYDTMPFPYLYPYAYSKADSLTALGQLHSLDPTNTNPTLPNPASPLTYNHAPLDTGDSLAVPTTANQLQSWFGFPTWKETMSPFWTDPVVALNTNPAGFFQTPGLSNLPGGNPISPVPLRTRTNSPGVLPPTYVAQPFSDGFGSAGNPSFDFYQTQGIDPDAFWEDDLIMSGVRSFDVKAYDPNAKSVNPVNGAINNLASGYYDLGYQSFYFPTTAGLTPPVLLPTLGHEGRMPPLSTDLRSDPQWAPLYNVNIGDDANQGGAVPVFRLRRVFDTWSTDYSRAPSTPLNPLLGPPYAQPVYPSYPPPYPAPLRGIQIQIRVVDPSNERVKVLTIRHDFTDKL